MLVHLGLVQPPAGWDPNRYDNVARMHSGTIGGQPAVPSGGSRGKVSAIDRFVRPGHSRPAHGWIGQEEALPLTAGAAPRSGAGPSWQPAPGFSQQRQGRSGFLAIDRGSSVPSYDKASEIVFGCEYDDARRNGVAYEDQLRTDLASSYYWSGNFLQDYVFFVANWHPLFGVLCSHPLHPWSKMDRLGALLISSSLTLLPSAWLSQASESMCEEFGDHSGKCGWLTGHILILAFITTPVMVVETSLYLFALYPNVYCHDCGLCVLLKRSFFLVSLIVAGFVFVVSMGLLRGIPKEELVHPFLVSRLQSWVIWFPLWFLMPCIGFYHYWNIERRSLGR